jgi:inhibitor of KinA
VYNSKILNCSYKIFPLGDAAACVDLGNIIDENLNKKVLAMHQWLKANSFEGLNDIVVAYGSLSVYYDPIIAKKKNKINTPVFEFVRQKLETAFTRSVITEESNSDIIHIPVCYSDEFGIDTDFISKQKNISKEEIVQLHTSITYRVYMVGFLPGFSYLGKVHEKLIMPRKVQPVVVAAGSVGITGGQTGIYPMNTPGGWQIIGRTPVKLFDSKANVPSLLNAGNRVQFFEISKEVFENYF